MWRSAGGIQDKNSPDNEGSILFHYLDHVVVINSEIFARICIWPIPGNLQAWILLELHVQK